MSVGTTGALVIGGLAVAGGVAGAIGKKSEGEASQGLNLSDPTALEGKAGAITSGNLGQMEDLTEAGPGTYDVKNSLGASRSLAEMLQHYQQTGGAPEQDDIKTGNSLAAQLFAPQHEQLRQGFTDQGYMAGQQAAAMGRDPNDPVLQAKLRTGFMNNEATLNSQQGAFGTNYAMNLPGQRLGYANQRANLLGGLATQAMNNRAAMLGYGSQVLGAERNFRVATADHWGNQKETSGGGLGGALSGAISGAGAGFSIAGGMGAFGAGGGVASRMAGSTSGVMSGFNSSTPMFGQSAMSSYNGGGLGANTSLGF